MHRCLKILELVDVICDNLDPHVARYPTFGDLAALARTCTTFQDAALDHLWRRAELGNLLFFCMPSDLWTVDHVEDDSPWNRGKKMRLLRPICDADWDRVRVYAPRIRVLVCGKGGWTLSDIFPAVSVAFPEPLLQNLRALTWQHPGADFHYIHLFLRPTLTEIVLTLSSDSGASLLPTLAEKCPKLINVSIKGHGCSARLFSDFVRKLQLLEKVSVPDLDQHALEHLAQLTTLKSLRVDRLPNISAWSVVPEVQVFPILDSLTLARSEIRATSRFLAPWRVVPLVNLYLGSVAGLTAAEAHTFFQVVSTAFSHSTLDSFSLSAHWALESELDPSTYLIPHRELLQLQCFTNLTTLTIHSSLGFDLDDAAVAALVPSWPRLRFLLLQARVHTHTPRTTLACLHSFARHCRRLRTLAIGLDATTVPTLDDRSKSHLRTLQYLHVDHSPLQSDHNAVADFIASVFPKLAALQTHREYYPNEDADDIELEEHGDAIRLHRRWKEVEGLLPSVVAVRAEEKRVLAWARGTA
ncbi:hypothetical protein C8R46DRAFT_1148887 [Mycena filopes]|nr:hypothetical protein C8R46DRAFT_1148887 [Mycena filopes]